MKKITIFTVAIATLLAASCAKDETSSGGSYSPVPVGESRFAVVTKTVSASTGDSAMVVLTESNLDSGTTTVIGNGADLGSRSPSQWTASTDGRYIYTVQDAGGELTAEVVQYYLDNATGLVKTRKVYNASAYHVWGMWGSDYLTARNTSFTSDGKVDPDNSTTYYAPCISAVYYSEAGSSAFGDPFASANYIGKNYSGGLSLDNGETANIVGFVTLGDYVYVSYATSGVSRYAILDGANSGWDGTTYIDYVTKGEGTYTCIYSKDVVIDENTTAFTSVSNSWNSGTSFSATVPFPLTPGNAYIARYSISGGLESTPEIIATDQMAQAYGRQSGNPYNTLVANNDDDYVYVFSPGVTRRYSATAEAKLTDGTVDEVTQYEYDGISDIAGTNEIDKLKIATTNKGAKVMRIKSGATEFDDSFGTKNIDIKVDGKEYVFSRVWHISGSKYLLRVIHTPGVFYLMHHNYRDPGDAYFFVYDTDTNTATQVTGLPDPSLFVLQTQSSIGEPYIDGNMVYIPMAPSNESYPAIWNFDASAAAPTATKGLTVKCSYIVSIAKLTAQ